MSLEMSKSIVVILGMRQAGASLVASLVNELGVELGDNRSSAGMVKLGESAEHADIRRVSDSIMRHLGRSESSPLGAAAFPCGWLEMPEIVEYRNQLLAIVQRELSNTKQVFGFANPNTTRLLPLWQSIFAELEIRPRYLLSIRHPASVANSLAERYPVSQGAAALQWGIHYSEAVEYLDDELTCVVSHEGWGTRPEEQLRHVIQKLDLSVGDTDIGAILDRHLESGQGRINSPEDEVTHPLTGKLYSQLEGLANELRKGDLRETARKILGARQLMDAWAESIAKDDRSNGPRVFGETDTLGWIPRPRDFGADIRELRPDCFDITDANPACGNTCIVMPEIGEEPGVIASELPLLEIRLWTLAENLASAGSTVTVLFPRQTAFAKHASQLPRDNACGHLDIVIAPRPEVPCRLYGKGPLARSVEESYRVYEFLKIRDFERVYFTDFRGIGCFSFAARHQGIRFAHTSLVLLLALPSSLIKETEKKISTSALDLIRNDMEHKCLQLADHVIATDCVDLAWLYKRGWDLPSSIDFLPLPVPFARGNVLESVKDPGGFKPARSLAYYGNLDEPSGIHVFCDALDRMIEDQVIPDHVYLVNVKQDNERKKRLRKRLERVPHSFHANLKSQERLAILNRPEVVTVIPVMHQMLSGEVLDCMLAGVRALVSEQCPHLAMLDDESRKASSVAAHPYYLAERLKRVLVDGLTPLRVNWGQEEINTSWAELEKRLSTPQRQRDQISMLEERAEDQAAQTRGQIRKQLGVGQVSVETTPNPLGDPVVSVCLIHYERPDFVNQTIESLELQSYNNFEVILVDDGSKSAAATENLAALRARFAKRGWQVIQQPNLSPGAARNRAASVARGRYLIFMDDDNYAKPHEIETFVGVAEHTGADAITCFRDAFNGNDYPPLGKLASQRIPALGMSISVSTFINCFGDTNALISKKAYQAVGGYNEQHRTGKEDYEFFCKLALRGFHLITIPEALYWYREHPVKRKRNHYNLNAGTLTVLSAFTESVPYSIRDAVMFGKGMSELIWDNKLTRYKLQARFKILNNNTVWKLVSLMAKTLRRILPRR